MTPKNALAVMLHRRISCKVKLTNNHETEKHRSRSASRESTTRTDEQTSTDRTTTERQQLVIMHLRHEDSVSDLHGNHLHVSAFQIAVKYILARLHSVGTLWVNK